MTRKSLWFKLGVMKLDPDLIKSRGLDYGRMGAKLAVQAAVLYISLTVVGFFGGGIGAYIVAAHFDYGGWWGLLAAIFGFGAGAVLGFVTAQIVIAGIIQDMMFSLGIKTGKMGYTHAKRLLAELRQKNTPPL